jgi:hypothetical protein
LDSAAGKRRRLRRAALHPKNPYMGIAGTLRQRVKAARRRGSGWVRAVELGRLVLTGEGRSQLWLMARHGADLHQSTPFTAEDRYPELFDLAATTQPNAARILSFGCSTGEEIAAIRARFPEAGIDGAEINPRSRRFAARRHQGDTHVRVIAPSAMADSYDIVFALAVLQREPHRIEEAGIEDLSPIYPFAKFDGAIDDLAERLSPGGLLCVANAHYRVEDSRAFATLEPVAGAPAMVEPCFARDGKRLRGTPATTMFTKRG